VQVTGALRAEASRGLQPFLSSVQIGVGLDVREIAELARSYSEAVVATQLRGARTAIRHLLEVDVNEYFRQTADPTARRLISRLPDEVLAEPLRTTLWSFAAANLNVKECARQLDVHTNTVYYRLNRVQRLTGLDPRNFAALSQIMTALQAS
jgi:carbohydrate diacid regulator